MKINEKAITTMYLLLLEKTCVMDRILNGEKIGVWTQCYKTGVARLLCSRANFKTCFLLRASKSEISAEQEIFLGPFCILWSFLMLKC